MVVANRRTWVDPQHLIQILKQDGYRKLSGEAEADVGDVVVYRDNGGEVCHAGIVTRKKLFDPTNPKDTLVILSKWGADGEYFHDASSVPELLGQPAEFWTDRKGV
jgi:hypothetical protein